MAEKRGGVKEEQIKYKMLRMIGAFPDSEGYSLDYVYDFCRKRAWNNDIKERLLELYSPKLKDPEPTYPFPRNAKQEMMSGLSFWERRKIRRRGQYFREFDGTFLLEIYWYNNIVYIANYKGIL